MNAIIGKSGAAENVLAAIGTWPERLPGRLRKKIMRFDRMIDGFRQRRWA